MNKITEKVKAFSGSKEMSLSVVKGLQEGESKQTK